jgi:hypothetical protein
LNKTLFYFSTNQGSTVKVGGKTIQLNGELTVNDCLDIVGRFYYFGSGFEVSEARLSYRLKISGAENFFDVILTSDHPSLPEARFAVSAEIVPEQLDTKKTILFSVVTPFSNFENLSGKLTFPNPEIGHVAPFKTGLMAEVVLPNSFGTHKLSLDFDVKGKQVK